MQVVTPPSVDLITVSYECWGMIKKNIQSTFEKNKIQVRWIVVLNGPEEQQNIDKLRQEAAVIKNAQVLLITGLPPLMTSYETGSYHHTGGIQVGLTHVNAPFFGVIDPDFFVLQQDGLKKGLELISKYNLGAFGTPWNPYNIFKQKNVLTPHFTLFNAQHVTPMSIDYAPTFDVSFKKRQKSLKYSQLAKKHKGRWSQLLKVWGLYLKKGVSMDSGTKVLKDHPGVPTQFLTFVARKKDLSDINKIYLVKAPKGFKRVLGLLFGILPCRPQEHQLLNKGREDLESVLKSWEFFQFKKQLFGLHLRRTVLNNGKTPAQTLPSDEKLIDMAIEYFR